MRLSKLTTKKGRIDKVEMLRMMDEGVPGSKIAKHFGVSEASVSEMKKRILKDQSKLSPDLRESSLGGKTIDALFQLKNMNDVILDELVRCRKFIDKEESTIVAYNALKAKAEKNPDDKKLQEQLARMLEGNTGSILKIQGNVISIAAEVRKQVELQLKIAETVYSVSMMVEFQEEVIEVLRTVDPKVRDEVVKRLKERRQIRGLLKDAK